ncbi:MAG: hypothetical protein ACLP9K_05790 [Nitrososphaerales archaeon]
MVLVVIISLGESKLIDPSVVVSLVVIEAPLTAFFYILERRRSKLSEGTDRIETANKYKHLRLHHWILGKAWFNILDLYVIENRATQTAFDCPSYLHDWGDDGIIEMVEHKNEKALRDFLERQVPPVKLVEREAKPRDLMPSKSSWP